MIRYFKKILPKNPAILSNGRKFLFPATASGVGLLAVDTEARPDLVRDFDLLMARGKGGIVEISDVDFEAEKKKTPRSRPFGQESFSPTQVNQMRRTADRVNAELADTKRERDRRQMTPVINRSFKRPGMKFAGATANPEPGQTQPGQWRPGISKR